MKKPNVMKLKAKNRAKKRRTRCPARRTFFKKPLEFTARCMRKRGHPGIHIGMGFNW
jgi:hypothetical protein